MALRPEGRDSMQPVCFPVAGLLLVLGCPDLDS